MEYGRYTLKSDSDQNTLPFPKKNAYLKERETKENKETDTTAIMLYLPK